MKKVLINCIIFAIICLTVEDNTFPTKLCKNGFGGLGVLKLLKECNELMDKLKQIQTEQGYSNESIAFEILSPYVNIAGKVCCPECYTPDGQSGVCRTMDECPYLMAMQLNPTDSNRYYLKHSQCYTNGNKRKLCCGPKPSPSSVNAKRCQMSAFPPSPNSNCCGVEATSLNKNVEGITPQIDEYPWVVLLEYQNNYHIETLCGGTLISGKYVLTAAHCVMQTKATNFRLPTKVRVGEFDTSNNGKDCVDIGNGVDCTEPAISIPIEKIISHPDYNFYTKWNDIAIIRLKYAANFTDFVRPICLPYTDINEAQLLPNRPKLFVAGWGKTSQNFIASQKQYVKVSLVDRKTCAYNYMKKLNTTRELWNRQLCAYGEGGKNACIGDSGSPLMFENTRNYRTIYEVVGLVSYDLEQCGEVPEIYTKVSSYIPWIRSHIKR